MPLVRTRPSICAVVIRRLALKRELVCNRNALPGQHSTTVVHIDLIERDQNLDVAAHQPDILRQ